MAQGTTRGVPIDTDITLAANSDLLVPSQKAIKTYADTKVSSVAGTSPIISSGGTTPSISIPLADGHTDGYLSASDFTTFSGKGDMLLASIQTNSGAKTFLDTTFLLRNVANTFNGSFVNTNTADRVYTLPDTTGTIALTSDLSNYVTYSELSSQLYRIVNNTDSATITGSTAATLLYSQLIPANTFAVNDVIRLSFRALKTGVTLGCGISFYVNTVNTLAGGIYVAQYAPSALFRMLQIDRKLYIKNITSNTEVYNTGVSNYLYFQPTANQVWSNPSIDWAVNQYIICVGQVFSSADSMKGLSYEIERIRTT